MFCRLWLQWFQAALKGLSLTLPSVLKCFFREQIAWRGYVVASQAAPRQKKEELLEKIVYVFIFDSHVSFFSQISHRIQEGCICVGVCLTVWSIFRYITHHHHPSSSTLSLNYCMIPGTASMLNTKKQSTSNCITFKFQFRKEQAVLDSSKNLTVCELF